MFRTALVITAATLVLGSPLFLSSSAQSQVNPGGLKWGPAPPSLPRGAQAAVLAGTPQAPGLFTIRLRFPPGYSVPPHSHPSDEYVTVISGQLSMGMGPRMNRARAARLVAGGFIVNPARMNHYGFTRTGAVLQVTGTGPFTVTYANLADDPRRRR
jgi:quercetin dioxygenase-like cupin family protein